MCRLTQVDLYNGRKTVVVVVVVVVVVLVIVEVVLMHSGYQVMTTLRE